MSFGFDTPKSHIKSEHVETRSVNSDVHKMPADD